jgi:molybdopterin-guanine dinucleotide biosynthesis protein A
MNPVRYDAVVLAGGAGRRLGGGGKPGLEVGGHTLLEWVLAAVADADRRIVVGLPGTPERSSAVTEVAAGGGPVPALRRGMAEVREAWVVLLAADLPFLRPPHVAALLTAASEPGEAGVIRATSGASMIRAPGGAMMVDDGGRPQWLAGCWRVAVLRAALAGYVGDSLRGLLGPLEPALVRVHDQAWRDCDTPEDLAWARERASGYNYRKSEQHWSSG